MKRSLIAVLCLGLGIAAFGQDITSDLEAYFPFDEFDGSQAIDDSGKNRNADVLGGTPMLGGGKIGNGMFFDGSSDLTISGYKGISGNAPRSVSYWCLTTSSGNMGAVGWGTAASPNGQKWHVRFNDNAGNGVVGAPRTEIQGSYIIATTPVNDGEWHHVVSVFSGTFMQDTIHYVDGVAEVRSGIGNQEVEVNTLTEDSTPDVTIGSRLQNTTFNYLVGSLDDVRIYSRALSPEDVQALYEMGTSGSDFVGVRSFSSGLVQSGESTTVTIDIQNPAAGTLTETFPEGWDISDVSNGGAVSGQTITWNLTSSVSSVSYKLTLPADAADAGKVFSGDINGIYTRGVANVDILFLQGPVGIFDHHADIGDVAVPGDASIIDGEYEVYGSGADIWGAADEFHFVFSEVSGSFSIKGNVFLDGFESTNDWVKTGFMVRNSLNSDAVNYTTIIRQSDFAQDSQWRLTKGGSSDSTSSNMNAAQVGDLEIVRIGNMFYTYYLDVDTNERTLYDSREIIMEDPVYVGLCVTSHSDGVLSLGLYQDVELNLYPVTAVRSIPDPALPMGGGTLEGIQVTASVAQGQTSSGKIVENLPAGCTPVNMVTTNGSTSVSGSTLTWTLDNLAGEATMTYDLEVTAAASEEFQTITGSADGALDTSGDDSLYPINFAIPMVNREITLDGKLGAGEYDGAYSEQFSHAEGDTTAPGVHISGIAYPANQENCTFHTFHNNSMLYVAMDVVDGDVVNFVNETNWRSDSVEFYLDGDMSRAAGNKGEAGGNDGGPYGFQATMRPDNVWGGSGSLAPAQDSLVEISGGWKSTTGTVWNGAITVKDDGSGYVAEYIIDLSAALKPLTRNVIGFDILMNSDDGSGDRTGKWGYWSTLPDGTMLEAWRDESGWAVVKLADFNPQVSVNDWSLY